MKITGECHCGAVAYEAEIDPVKVGICHCADCQALSASAYRNGGDCTSRDIQADEE